MTKSATQSLSGRATKGGLWVVLGKAFETISRMGGNIVLSWLLFPEDFGFLVPVNVFLLGLQLFSDIGIGPSIVRSERGEDPVFLRTVWTFQVFRGVFLYLVCLALAGPYARWMGDVVTESGIHEQEIIYRLLLVSGLSALFLGLRSPHWFTVDRRIAQGRKTLILVLSQGISVSVMIFLAWLWRSPMAMVVGGVTGAFCQSLLSHILLPGVHMAFRLEKEALRELFGFGRWIFLSTAIFFLASQVDRIMVSQLLELGPRGLYRIAMVIAALVPTVLSPLSNTVVFPTWMESFRKQRNDHAQRVRRSRRALIAVAMSGMIGVIVVSPFFFTMLYPERFHGAAVIAQLLCIPFWFETLMASATSALLVHGDSKVLPSANFLVLLFKAPACWFGFQWFGLEGFILGIAVGNIPGLLRMHLRLQKHGTPLLRQDVESTLMLLALGGGGYFISSYAENLGGWSGIVLGGLTALGLTAFTLRPAYSLYLKKA